MSMMVGEAWWQEQEAENSHLDHTQEAQSSNWKWDKAINSKYTPPPVVYFFQQGSPPTTSVLSPKCASNQEPSVRTHEPTQGLFHPDHQTFLDHLRNFITGIGNIFIGLELIAANTLTSARTQPASYTPFLFS